MAKPITNSIKQFVGKKLKTVIKATRKGGFVAMNQGIFNIDARGKELISFDVPRGQRWHVKNIEVSIVEGEEGKMVRVDLKNATISQVYALKEAKKFMVIE